uniref:EF-hand domain-containing protein n=1 Tax=Plectus sambesii TaxID=2011161 RepID=A0A914VZS7_9BILA
MMQTLVAALFLLLPYVQCGGIRFRADPGATSSSAAVNVGVAPMLAIPPPFPMFPQESNDEQFKRADDDKNGKLNFNEFLYKERYYIEAKKNEFKQFDTDST